LHGCRKPAMDQCANCGDSVLKECNLTNHEKSETHQYELQYKAKEDLISVSKEIYNDIRVI